MSQQDIQTYGELRGTYEALKIVTHDDNIVQSQCEIGTNETGFSGFMWSAWWTSTGSNGSYIIRLASYPMIIKEVSYPYDDAYQIRCVKD